MKNKKTYKQKDWKWISIHHLEEKLCWNGL